MRSLIINCGSIQQKIVYLNNNQIEGIFVENIDNKSIAGNIYRGKVEKILKGMEAAFIDIGTQKSGYLPLAKNSQIKQGQDILVQIKKEGTLTKGPKLTTEISIPSRNLVLVCNDNKIGISNKIKCEEEKTRLKDIISKIKPDDKGVIIRTQAVGTEKTDLENEFKDLIKIWEDIKINYNLGMGPKLLFEDVDIISKTIRDTLNDQLDEIVINDNEKYLQIKQLIKTINPSYVSKVKYFDEPIDIFEYYNINNKIKNLLDKKVYLKGGGYIVIDKTEALTVIDVNTGKFTGDLELDKTVFKVNCEAAHEIVKQIRLRDISGIIIVDFIDMQSEKYKHSLIDILSKSLLEIGASVQGLTNLGLVEIVRRKTKNSLQDYFKMSCPICKGSGKVDSIYSVLDYIEKEIKRIKNHTSLNSVTFEIPYYLYENLTVHSLDRIEKLKKENNINITLKECKDSEIKAVLRG